MFLVFNKQSQLLSPYIINHEKEKTFVEFIEALYYPFPLEIIYVNNAGNLLVYNLNHFFIPVRYEDDMYLPNALHYDILSPLFPIENYPLTRTYIDDNYKQQEYGLLPTKYVTVEILNNNIKYINPGLTAPSGIINVINIQNIVKIHNTIRLDV